MSDPQFDIIFRGDIVFGHQLTDVKARLQQLFKADAAKVDALFSGRPVPLKRGLDLSSAQKYKDALIKAGAQVDIVATGEAKPAATPPVRSASPPIVAAAPLSLAQRLDQQAAADQVAAEEAAALREQEVLEQAKRDAAAVTSSSVAQSSWSLAPVGAYLLQPSEKVVEEAAAIDTSAISLRAEGGGNILDASEQPPAPTAVVVAPNYEVAEVGADLVSADEKMELPLLELELADWTLADLGEDLIAASEKAVVAVPFIQVLDVGLAPVGADLGQLKPKVQVVVPDVSGISLAD